ncbi:hypothetical protein PsorP6_008084 [Peronosclerospora sorghi]|uniref:Uncharacterized protein n=1 Tax=Peronosclerospora sorghi TaxID=230839 RepID=A0ACC0W9U6_9STRA|nr:hypothetical protein PsorP6_008084 [Peronosclerospora sorghi]
MFIQTEREVKISRALCVGRKHNAHRMSRSGIDGGAVWREEIARGITNCSLVLSILCHGYSKSEWCLKELALAKMLRKPLLGLIVEEDHPAAMASLEPLLPYRHRIRFNDFIVAKRDEIRAPLCLRLTTQRLPDDGKGSVLG